MADIYFMCSCQKHLAVDEAGAGQTVACPDCGKPVEVPKPEIGWFHLACGNEMSAPKSMAGRIVQCVKCKANALVPMKTAEPSTRKPVAAPRLATWGPPSPDKDKITVGRSSPPASSSGSGAGGDGVHKAGARKGP